MYMYSVYVLLSVNLYFRGVEKLLSKGAHSAGSDHHGNSDDVSDSGSLTHVEAMVRLSVYIVCIQPVIGRCGVCSLYTQRTT